MPDGGSSTSVSLTHRLTRSSNIWYGNHWRRSYAKPITASPRLSAGISMLRSTGWPNSSTGCNCGSKRLDPSNNSLKNRCSILPHVHGPSCPFHQAARNWWPRLPAASHVVSKATHYVTTIRELTASSQLGTR